MSPKHFFLVLTTIVAITLVTMLAGCVEDRGELFHATPATQNPAVAGDSTLTPSAQSNEDGTKSGEESLIVAPLAAWWDSQWSDDGFDLNVQYTKGSNSLKEIIHVGKSYTPDGGLIAGSEVKYRRGEDIYGRKHNMTIGSLSGWHATVKPDTVVAYGRFSAPAMLEYADAWFTRELNITVTYEYGENGKLTGGSGNESFSGHIMTEDGTITYTGAATATFSVKDGTLMWSDRTEKTTYYYDGEPYAETVTVVTPESEYLGGYYRKVRETVQTTTRYADGSLQESEIVLVWQLNAGGVTSGRSGSGVVSGTEIVKGTSLTYEGAITLDYGFDTRIGWYKSGYSEKRSADKELPKRLPFEVIYIDDLYLRPVF